jgi:hypothetical protein
MAPPKPLPHSPEFKDANEYVNSLLDFCAASTVFQTLCGGVHILDFFTREPSLFHTVIPEEWREWLVARDSMALLDFLMRDDLASPESSTAPASLLKYVHDIRRHSLDRTFKRESAKDRKLPLQVATGMNIKKKHEVSNFASYISRVADSVAENDGKEVTHFVDFGSGQNYLGRTLASPPYNKHIIAVESKELNISGAKGMDVMAGLAKREKVMRNKKIHRAQLESLKPADELDEKALRRRERKIEPTDQNEADMRPVSALNTIYTPEEGKGYVQYVEHIVKDGNLGDVVEQIEQLKISAPQGELALVHGADQATQAEETIAEISKEEELRLMAISIHSCGNLSHHGIRSLLLNPSVHAIAIVGCCYNLLTERFGSTYKLPTLRPNLTAINSMESRRVHTADCHGFPMSDKVATHGENGIQLNITSRMMAVQAPHNWTEKESDSFFTRHFYRALLQRVFLDYGVVKKIVQKDENGNPTGMENTEAVIIGSLRKFFYGSFKSYVRGALEKLAQDPERGEKITGKMSAITDEDIDGYDEKYRDLKKELSVAWSLMAFSAGVVESLIVVDRWLFLREHKSKEGGDGGVSDCWVEAVFDYSLSPRNLVVVGVKQ